MLRPLFALLFVAACTAPRTASPLSPVSPTVTTLAQHDTRHHTPRGFRNVHADPVPLPPLRAAWWMATWPFRAGKANVPAATRPVDLDALRQKPGKLRVTWLGHSSTYVQTPAASILLDPMAAHRASPLSFAGPERFVPFALDPRALPGVDVVVHSHDHYDHLDPQTVKTLVEAFDPLFAVPLGLGRIVEKMGARRIVELDWWQAFELDGITYTCAPARHFSGRSLTNRNETLWASWHLRMPDATLYYAGDTGVGTHFTEIRDAFGPPDVVLVPIGAYEPRWFMEEVHVTPAEALDATRTLGARHVVPVHYGTFDLADEPLGEPLDALRRACAPGDPALHPLAIGQSWTLP